MSRQHVEFKVPGTDKDSGEEDLTAIKPVADGEPAQASVFKRPSENLRTRTEFIRDELENLKYLSDYDRAFLLTSTGSVTWAGLPTGTFTASAAMTLKPFLAPAASTASRLIIGANTASQITIRTRQDGATGQPRAYNGANTISFDFTPLTNNPILITVDGSPANNFHVRYDDNPATGTTNAQLIAALQANAAFTTTWGLEAVMEGNGVPPEVGFPPPPMPVGSDKVIISGPEQALRFLAGAAEAELHLITPAHLIAFFADPLNALTEGDVIAVRYDELVMSPTYGGRRQSLNEAAEAYPALVAGANLFLVRRFPARIPLALPIAAVVNGVLIFVNGRSFNSGETGPLVSAGASYQGSPAAPNSWADSTVVAGPISFEVALDTIIQTLGTKTGITPGAIKVGFSPSGDIATNNVKAALEELDSKKASRAPPQDNTFTNTNVFTPSTSGTDGITATGNGLGKGVQGTGGAGDGIGVFGTGGGANGTGVQGLGQGQLGRGGYFQASAIAIAAVTGAEGVKGKGATNTGAGAAKGGAGVYGEGGDALLAGNAGPGVYGIGGTNSGIGVRGEGVAAGAGVSGRSGASINAPGGDFTSIAGTAGPGVQGLGSGTGPGVKGTGGASTNSNGGEFSSNATNGNGVLGTATGTGFGVQGLGSTNNANTGSGTNGVNPAAGPGTGVTGIGSSGSGGGDGVQGFARSAVGGTTSRTGVLGTGSYSQTTGVPGGAGGFFLGGSGTVGVANGGIGVNGQGGNGIGGGVKGTGVSGTGETGGVFASNSLTNGNGVTSSGAGVGAGVAGFGDSAFYTPASAGEGVLGSGSAFGTGVKGIGGSGVSYGVDGEGGGGNAGVYGHGRDGDSPGVKGEGSGIGVGVHGKGGPGGVGVMSEVSGNNLPFASSTLSPRLIGYTTAKSARLILGAADFHFINTTSQPGYTGTPLFQGPLNGGQNTFGMQNSPGNFTHYTTIRLPMDAVITAVRSNWNYSKGNPSALQMAWCMSKYIYTSGGPPHYTVLPVVATQTIIPTVSTVADVLTTLVVTGTVANKTVQNEQEFFVLQTQMFSDLNGFVQLTNVFIDYDFTNALSYNMLR